MEQPRLQQVRYHRPPPRVDRLARPALLHRLNEATDARVVLVTAPAGFGKTTFVADWIEERQPTYSWLGLDRNGGNPIEFWRDLITSIRVSCPDVGGYALEVLRSGSPERVHQCCVSLCNDLRDRAKPDQNRNCIVIDDYHVVDNELIHTSLGELAETLPDGIQLIIIARTIPEIPLARLRGRGKVIHIEHAQLRFAAAETREFIQRCTNVTLEDEAVALLHDKTEGWPAGLQLVALSLPGTTDPAGFIAGLRGDHGVLQDYLTEEVLQNQSDYLRRFLEVLAPLERFCEPLCQALIDQYPELSGRQARALLDELERMNLFLIPLDNRHEWFRFHHLFRDVLMRRSQAAADRETGLRVAARWLQDQGYLDEAMALALELGDLRWVELLTLQGAGLRDAFEVREWLTRLPQSFVASSPVIIYIGIAVGLMSGQPREAQHWLQLLTRLGRERETWSDDSGLNLELDSYAAVPKAWQDASIGNDKTSSTAADAVGRNIAALPETALAGRGRLLLVQSEMLFQASRLDEAITAAQTAIEISGALEMGRIIGASYGRLGECQAIRGRLRELDKTIANGQRAVSHTSAADQLNASGFLEKLRCELLVEQFELEQAQHLLLPFRERCQRESHHYLDLASGLLLTQTLRCRGQLEQALQLVLQLVRISEQQAIRLWYMPSPGALWAQINLEMGNLHAAMEWAYASGFNSDDTFNHLRERDYLMFVRLLVAKKELTRAVDLVQRVGVQAHQHGRDRIAVEAQVLEAAILHSRDGSGFDPFSAALVSAAREGLVFPFLENNESLQSLLQMAAEQEVEPEHVAWIQSKARNISVATALILSRREAEVLKLMATGQPNKKIASKLDLSPNTVKTHISNIYQKLDVANRTQAVSRASVMGLI